MVRIFDKEDKKDDENKDNEDDDENMEDELLGIDLSRDSLPRFYVHWKQKTSLTRGLECR